MAKTEAIAPVCAIVGQSGTRSLVVETFWRKVAIRSGSEEIACHKFSPWARELP